jgi:hypothetical protein
MSVIPAPGRAPFNTLFAVVVLGAALSQAPLRVPKRSPRRPRTPSASMPTFTFIRSCRWTSRGSNSRTSSLGRNLAKARWVCS